MLDIRNMDCMELMAQYQDKHFELAIVDPPYGIGAHNEIGLGDSRNGNRKESKWIGGEWDNEKPDANYFSELFRVSKNQIIWGGNYFNLHATRCFFIWDKIQRIDQADCEMAWTSFNGSARIFQFARGNLQGFMNPNRFHPTEKPIALYKWLLHNYAKQGDNILDTHLGSGSIAIACHQMGFDLTGSELDKDYFEAMQKRIKYETAQKDLFSGIE